MLSAFTALALANFSARLFFTPISHELQAARRRAFGHVRQLVGDNFHLVTLRSDEPVYLGGGIMVYPRDILHTTITVNWKKIAAEALTVRDGPARLPYLLAR
jgi:hypothetical protein